VIAKWKSTNHRKRRTTRCSVRSSLFFGRCWVHPNSSYM